MSVAISRMASVVLFSLSSSSTNVWNEHVCCKEDVTLAPTKSHGFDEAKRQTRTKLALVFESSTCEEMMFRRQERSRMLRMHQFVPSRVESCVGRACCYAQASLIIKECMPMTSLIEIATCLLPIVRLLSFVVLQYMYKSSVS